MLTTFVRYSHLAVPPTHFMKRFRGLQQRETEDQALAWVVISVVVTTVCMVQYNRSSIPYNYCRTGVGRLDVQSAELFNKKKNAAVLDIPADAALPCARPGATTQHRPQAHM